MHPSNDYYGHDMILSWAASVHRPRRTEEDRPDRDPQPFTGFDDFLQVPAAHPLRDDLVDDSVPGIP